MAVFSGTVTVKGQAAEGRVVRAVDRSTGFILDESMTDAIGRYSLDTDLIQESNVIIIALPTEAPGETESFNAVILDQF